MKLPNREEAYVPTSKLIAYLISETHSVGKSKARFLRAAGFSEINIDLLKNGLLSIARTADVQEAISSQYGVKYVLDGPLQTPEAGAVMIRTVWIIDKDRKRARFVTAYPL